MVLGAGEDAGRFECYTMACGEGMMGDARFELKFFPRDVIRSPCKSLVFSDTCEEGAAGLATVCL